MIKYLFSISLLACFYQVDAQNCNVEFLLQRPGIWNSGMKGSVTGINAVDLAKERKVVASFLAMMKKNYAPRGIDAQFAEAYSAAETNRTSNDYHLAIYPMQYYCEGNNAKKAHETSNYFRIGANMFNQVIYTWYTDESPDLPGFFFIDKLPVWKDSCWYFEEKVTLGFGQAGISKTWLITYDGKLPYSYVTQKEFLEKRKMLINKSLPGRIENAREGIAYVESQKLIKEKEYKNDPERWKTYLKYIYELDKAKQEKDLIRIENDVKKAIANIDKALSKPETELNQKAIVKKDPNDYMNFLFVTDDDPFAKVLIKPNPGYFNAKLPRSAPQFISVQITGPTKEPVSFRAITDLEKAVDFSMLRNMLGK